MSSWREQTLIEAPVDTVWREVGDPSRYPLWAGDVVEVTDLDRIEEGAHYRQKMRTPFGKSESEFVVEQLDEFREIQVRCMLTGYYLHWVLTEAGDDTFAEVEIGMDPKRVGHRAFDATLGRRWYRRAVDETLDRLRAVIR